MTSHHDEPPREAAAGEREMESMNAPDRLDPELSAVAESLRRMPAVRPGAVARVVAAATGSAGRAALPARRPWVGLTAAAAAAVIAAAGFGFAARGRVGAGRDVAALPAQATQTSGPTTEPSLAMPASAPAALSRYDAAAEDAPVLVPFVLREPAARRVAVVGDFNGWSPTAAPLARDANGVWTTTLAVTPGRHAYGFVVDDTLWVRDPRAETERDDDYGRDHSVIVVGRP